MFYFQCILFWVFIWTLWCLSWSTNMYCTVSSWILKVILPSQKVGGSIVSNTKTFIAPGRFFLKSDATRGRERHRKSLWMNLSLIDTRETQTLTDSDRFVSTSKPNWLPSSTELNHYFKFLQFSYIFQNQVFHWCDVISLKYCIINIIWFHWNLSRNMTSTLFSFSFLSWNLIMTKGDCCILSARACVTVCTC